jgi:hypothetical protein
MSTNKVYFKNLTHDFTFKYKSLFLDCKIEYEPSQEGSREIGTGLQLEPDYDAVADVISVSLNGVDVTDIIREDILDEISDAFLNQKEVAWDYDYE